MKLLYLDDESDILDLVRIFFLDHGLTIATASSPSQALQRVREEDFELIISDARMPEMNGLEFYQVLRSEMGYKGHFILVSGHFDYLDLDHIPQGIDRVLMKPIEFDDLFKIVQELEIKSK
jgi:CheY-like chemotaxis protein